MQTLPELDFLAPETLQQPFAFYDLARRDAPVLKLPNSPVPGRDVYLVTRHDLVTAVLQNWRLYSNRFGFLMNQAVEGDAEIGATLAAGAPWVDTLLTQDPPAHRQYRTLVARIFGAARVERMGDYILRICDELIDAFIARGECDFFADFAVPLPIFVIADQLGVSRADLPAFKRWTDDYVASIGGMGGREAALAGARAVVSIQGYFTEAVRRRRLEPKDDIVSDLAHARLEDGRLLDLPELLSILHQLLVAGNETTRNALAGGIVRILAAPGMATTLREDQAALAAAVEEILRLEAPNKHMWRVVTAPVTLGGVDIPADVLLLLSYDAGNRDPAEFLAPDAFMPNRANIGRHLSFGSGGHFCIGAMLARKEMAIAYARLLQRLPNLRLTPGRNPLAFAPSIIHRAYTSLHLSFDSPDGEG